MLRPAQTPPHLATLVCLTSVSVLSLNMFLPSLANMAADFQADYALVNLSIAGYLAVTALLQLVIGPLSDHYGRRPVMLAALCVFTVASLGCALAGDIWVFLAFRLLQGAVISGWAVSQAAIRDSYPPGEAASLLGYVVMAMAVAPMLGPVAGGFLDAWLGWRSNFYLLAAGGAAMLLVCWLDLGETNRSPAETLMKQIRAYPLLFRSARFWGYALCMAFSIGAFYAFLSGVPLVADQVLRLSPAELGIYMGSISGGFFLGSFLSGRYARRCGLTAMILSGRLLACAGLIAGLVLFAFGLVTPLTVFGATIFVGLGNGLTVPSVSAGAMSIHPTLAGSASGLVGSLTVGLGALLTSVTGAIVGGSDAASDLVWMMLLCSAAGLLAVLAVRRLERGGGPAA